jgi:hypothetical protein
VRTRDHAGTLLSDTRDEWTRGRAKMTIHLPTNRVLHDSDLIDRVIAAVFDHLEHTAVVLQVGGESEEMIGTR